MEYVVVAGVVLTLIGLAGLLVCVVRANGIRKSGGSPEDNKAALQKLVALNFGALALSVIGLMCVLLGLMLQG